MIIKILGTGCKNCVRLSENTEAALQELGLKADIVKITEIQDIMSYGIMSTPGLVIDDEVVSYGKVLKPKEIVKILEKVK
ncbi:thioredoxin family protein [Bacillus sp. T3]|uniref:thioredoxin family protein n=1 Tax=Bacillus sp. T3 TaxID=467262 RepID=UPI002981F83E|nr:thioredoxin family protein [Bacillus sp. T3]